MCFLQSLTIRQTTIYYITTGLHWQLSSLHYMQLLVVILVANCKKDKLACRGPVCSMSRQTRRLTALSIRAAYRGTAMTAQWHDTTTASAVSITVINGLVCVAQLYVEVGWHRCWHHASRNLILLLIQPLIMMMMMTQGGVVEQCGRLCNGMQMCRWGIHTTIPVWFGGVFGRLKLLAIYTVAISN